MEKTYRHNYQEQYKDSESNLAKSISSLINRSGNDLRANAECFATYEHRYLQNELFKFFIYYTKELAYNAQRNRFDARNEYACKLSAELLPVIENFILR